MKASSMLPDNLTSDQLLDLYSQIKKNEAVDQVHPYAVSPPSGTRKYWRSRVKDTTRSDNRKPIKGKTKQIIYDKLHEHYFGASCVTLKMVFNRWVDKQIRKNRGPRTIKRYRERWNKYYENHPISSMNINDISTEFLEDFFAQMIDKHKLTKKELQSMKQLVVDSLHLAVTKRMLMHSPCYSL